MRKNRVERHNGKGAHIGLDIVLRGGWILNSSITLFNLFQQLDLFYDKSMGWESSPHGTVGKQ